MRNMTDEQRKELEFEISQIMRSATSSEYSNDILQHEDENGTTLMQDIVQNVLETSGWEDEGIYNDSDIRLAIGRELMNRLGISY